MHNSNAVVPLRSPIITIRRTRRLHLTGAGTQGRNSRRIISDTSRRYFYSTSISGDCGSQLDTYLAGLLGLRITNRWRGITCIADHILLASNQMRQPHLCRPFVVWAITLISVVLLFMAVAHAHDSHRPELNEWFMGLHSDGGAWCCNGDDTTQVDEWESKDGHYRVKVNGRWLDVPDDAVISKPNLDGQTLVWLKAYPPNAVRCFMPGAGG